MKRLRAALFFYPSVFGALAQLVAHLLCKQRVAGSNPACSTFTLGILGFQGFFVLYGSWFRRMLLVLGRAGTDRQLYTRAASPLQ